MVVLKLHMIELKITCKLDYTLIQIIKPAMDSRYSLPQWGCRRFPDAQD